MRRSYLSLVIGIVLGILAVAIMYNYVSNAQRVAAVQAPPAIDVANVVVATKDTPFGTPIVRESLKIVPWPKASIPQDAFTNVDEIFAGATVPRDRIAIFRIAHDEPVTKGNVSGFGAKATLSYQVKEGMRAISIRVDDVVGVSGFVLPGDRVDIFLTRRMENIQTQVLLQDITIIGIDQVNDQGADKPIVARTATVEVTPEQAQKLVLAQQAGALSLSLRGVMTQGEVASKTLTDGDLSGPRPAAPRAPQPAPVRLVAGPALPPAPALPTVRVRYGDGSAVDKVVRP
jgi:pilus assembly protein CpaB